MHWMILIHLRTEAKNNAPPAFPNLPSIESCDKTCDVETSYRVEIAEKSKVCKKFGKSLVSPSARSMPKSMPKSLERNGGTTGSPEKVSEKFQKMFQKCRKSFKSTGKVSKSIKTSSCECRRFAAALEIQAF